MLVVFVHGWSVTNTATYGGLPVALAANAGSRALAIDIAHLFLGRYVSFSDEVTLDDIARGMQNALRQEILPRLARNARFACVTHSTGGPVVRKWIDLYFNDGLDRCPMSHLIMLAPANHGSALAQLGKSRLARLKFYFEGVQPGTGVLDWLELGSEETWRLNTAWLGYDFLSARLFPFVLTGQSIDRDWYDNLNSYTGEPGSDGVVRVAAANLNYGLLRLSQDGNKVKVSKTARSQEVAFGVLPGLSHSGSNMGVMQSVSASNDGSHPTVKWILNCLSVTNAATYRHVVGMLDQLTKQTQGAERTLRTKEGFLVRRTFKTSRYCMIVFRVLDDRGTVLSDYDILITAGPHYDEDNLAPGFFRDRQRNSHSPWKLTYYIDYDVMETWLLRPELEQKIGFRVVARPTSGYAYYTLAEYRGTLTQLRQYFAPNQTFMVEIELRRMVTEGIYTLTNNLEPVDFRTQPPGEVIANDN